MNVVLDHIVFHLQNAGGISTYWYELSKYLVKQQDTIISHTLMNTVSEGIHSSWVDSLPRTVIDKRPLKLARYLKAPVGIKGKAIFHSSYYRLPQRTGLATVVTVHDFTYEHFRKGLPRLVHTKQKNTAICHADAIICVSENTKQDLLFFLPEINEANIHVIHHGASEDYRRLYGTISEFPELQQNPFVLFVGDRGCYKRFDIAVLATKRHAKLSLVIAGSQLSKQEIDFLNINLHNRWRYIGRISNIILNILYNLAFALIYPSSYEGFGMPVLEGMKSGCPVICSNLSSIPEVAGTAAVLVCEQSYEAYANAIEILFNPKIRAAIVESGLKHSASFTWEKCCKSTLDVYREVYSQKFGCEYVV
ncbi:MAG TPA: glycosyltransferase family 1 protein [Desulfuromonadaceae bacterium]|jgi:mannosyltransferase